MFNKQQAHLKNWAAFRTILMIPSFIERTLIVCSAENVGLQSSVCWGCIFPTLASQCAYINLRSCNAAVGVFFVNRMSLSLFERVAVLRRTIHTVAYFLLDDGFSATDSFSIRLFLIASCMLKSF